MVDTVRLYNGYDVDLEQLAEDLRELSMELTDGNALLMAVSTEQSVEPDDNEEVTITLTVKGRKGSTVAGGYTIPYDH